MQNRNYLSSSYARILFRHLRLSEEKSAAFFKGTTVSYDDLMSLDGCISGDELAQMYRNACAISGRDDLGFSVGTQLHLSTHGPLGVAIFSGPDLRKALGLLARYSQTRFDLVHFSVNESPAGMTVTLIEGSELHDLRIFITESVFSSIFAAINHFTGDHEFSGKVCFSYSKPGYGEKYYDHYGADIAFDCPYTSVFVPSSQLSIPSPVADLLMHEQSVAICERQLNEVSGFSKEPPTQSTEAAVSSLIAENPGRIWSLGEVADTLHMSSRTLIRKLEAEGTKFQVVRDEVAKKQAVHYLSDAKLTVETVAHLMGFSDASSFRRSFKRWFGKTPSQYFTRSK